MINYMRIYGVGIQLRICFDFISYLEDVFALFETFTLIDTMTLVLQNILSIFREKLISM